MPRDGEQQPCFHTGCNGTMTYYTKLKVDETADPPVQPGDTVGLYPDPHYAGGICDVNWEHHRFDTP